MSLSRAALRMITVRALRGQTLAGARVYDSQIDPMDLRVDENRQPYLVVYTDDHTKAVTGRDLRAGEDTCELVIEVEVAARVAVPITGGEGEETVIGVPHTDAGMEMVLDLIGHQIGEALMAGTSIWSRLWRDYALRVREVVSRRGAASENGIRFAARQIVVRVDLMGEPLRGHGVSPMWARLFTAMEAEPELAGLGAVMRYQIEAGGILTPELLAASAHGLNPETVESIGLTPVRDEDGDAVTADTVIVETPGAPDSPWEIEPEPEPDA